VSEDNAARQVTAARVAPDPLSIALLVDMTSAPPARDAGTPDLRKALASFVSAVHATAADTALSLTACAGAAVTVVNFTTTTDDLRRAIQHLTPSGPPSGAHLLEAFLDASTRLGQRSSPRRAIVAVDFDNSVDGSELVPSRVIDAVHAAGVTLWAFSIQRTGVAFGPEAESTPQTQPSVSREMVLERLPALTGGERRRLVGTSALESNLLRLADVLTHQYLVTYIRPDAKPVASITASSSRGAKTLMAPWVR
jgi:hypothetical protein